MLLQKISDRESISVANRKSLLKINCEIKFIQRQIKIHGFSQPEIELKVVLEHIALNLGHGQLQQIIYMSEHLNLFFKELDQRKKFKATINEKEKEQYTVSFEELQMKLYNSKDQNILKALKSAEQQKYRLAVVKLDIETLQQIIKQIVKKYEEKKKKKKKKKKKPEIIKKKKKKTKKNKKKIKQKRKKKTKKLKINKKGKEKTKKI
eukprot:TRINITY_DN8863_c0_g1_i1.p1 TRINITY_DN8863_c0_g1~~TRINITY_DN8863_c0_g1_i1.p1  ORF type:complete len:207 (-),score=62.08 TRINITY_DN8863_c0_g1_i1:16-636(-)